MSRPRGLSLVESLVAVTLLGTLVLSVMTLFVMAGRHRMQGENRARGAAVLGQQMARVVAAPSRFLTATASSGWVQEGVVPPEFQDVEVYWRWEDEPSGQPDLALVRVRAIWKERALESTSLVTRKVEGAVVVERP